MSTDTSAPLFPLPAMDRRFAGLKGGKTLRELLMIYGHPGTGKSHLILQVALWHQNLGSDARFYIISTDEGYGPILQNEEFYNLDNLEVTEVSSLQEAINAAKKYRGMARAQDFIIGDRVDHCWSWAAKEYAQAQAGGQLDSVGDLWKAEGLSGDKYPIEGWNWGPINARYDTFRSYLLSSKAHIIVTSDAKELMAESRSGKTGEDPQTKGEFKHVGWKPAGQKGDGGAFHTFLYVATVEPKKPLIVTAKEKFGNRRWLGKKFTNGSCQPEPIEDLFMDYFVDVAGWTIS